MRLRNRSAAVFADCSSRLSRSAPRFPPVVDELVDGPAKIAGAFAIAVVQRLGLTS